MNLLTLLLLQTRYHMAPIMKCRSSPGSAAMRAPLPPRVRSGSPRLALSQANTDPPSSLAQAASIADGGKRCYPRAGWAALLLFPASTRRYCAWDVDRPGLGTVVVVTCRTTARKRLLPSVKMRADTSPSWCESCSGILFSLRAWLPSPLSLL